MSGGRVFIRINLEDENLISILLFDTNPFWQQIVDFFGQIASGILPAACEHLRVFQLTVASPKTPDEYRVITRLLAELLDVPQNFRLKIFTKSQEETEFLLLDEVLDRQQFTNGPIASFEQFLKKEYQVAPDNDGNTFDLRMLSLEKFDQS
jgi:hypothetical protein